jgi:predicted amidohydrolase
MARISIAQLCPKLLDPTFNAVKVIAWMEEAAKEGSRLIIFPELSLTGYSVADELFQPDILEKLQLALKDIRKASKSLNIDAIISYPLVSNSDASIVAEYISRGETKSIHSKIYLANYGHCIEHKYFKPGNSVQVIETELGKIAILICEDAWHLTTSVLAAQMGADIIVFSSASSVIDPKDLSEMKFGWETITSCVGFSQTCFAIYCNRVGTEKDLTFWGGSHLVSPSGTILKRLPPLEERLEHLSLDMEILNSTKEKRPLVLNEKIRFNYEGFKNLLKV